MNILDRIVAAKHREVERRQALYPRALLEGTIYFPTPPVSLRKYLDRPDKSGVIAEFKRKSPSKGDINPHAPVERTTIGYMQAGASALSVLTDEPFFGGKNEDLTTARRFNFCPILRKDFVIDEYQIVEAKAIGADAVLLIAAVLPPDRVKALAALARSLGLEVLLEVHDRAELERSLTPEVSLVGVNNRNLKDFTVSIETSRALAEHIPAEFTKVSESGLTNPADVVALREHGYAGFLIGEEFMRHGRPERACARFIKALGQRSVAKEA